VIFQGVFFATLTGAPSGGSPRGFGRADRARPRGDQRTRTAHPSSGTAWRPRFAFVCAQVGRGLLAPAPSSREVPCLRMPLPWRQIGTRPPFVMTRSALRARPKPDRPARPRALRCVPGKNESCERHRGRATCPQVGSLSLTSCSVMIGCIALAMQSPRAKSVALLMAKARMASANVAQRPTGCSRHCAPRESLPH
jgi:hypothetical protein